MVSREFTVRTPLGLHARPAIQFVQKANELKCDIQVTKGEKKANARSISQVLALKVRQSDKIELRVHGENEGEILNDLVRLLSSEAISEESRPSGEQGT
jgi:phosphocarrier protein HPr